MSGLSSVCLYYYSYECQYHLFGSTGSHSESQLKRDVDKLRTTGTRPPRACQKLEEVIYHEELNEFDVSPRKQRTNKVSWSQSKIMGFVLPNFPHLKDRNIVTLTQSVQKLDISSGQLILYRDSCNELPSGSACFSQLITEGSPNTGWDKMLHFCVVKVKRDNPTLIASMGNVIFKMKALQSVK